MESGDHTGDTTKWCIACEAESSFHLEMRLDRASERGVCVGELFTTDCECEEDSQGIRTP